MEIQLFCEIAYVHRRMCLEIKQHVIFDVNSDIILQYSTFVQSQVIIFAHNTYFEEILLELRLNSYKGGIFLLRTRKCERGGNIDLEHV